MRGISQRDKPLMMLGDWVGIDMKTVGVVERVTDCFATLATTGGEELDSSLRWNDDG